jgi:hypothetical protein
MLCLTVHIFNLNLSKVTVRFKVFPSTYSCGRLVFGMHIYIYIVFLFFFIYIYIYIYIYIVWIYTFMQIL